MTPERAAALVARWVRCYTQGLPAPVAERRREELDADLHDHIAHERSRGTGELWIALGVLARMLRGLAADALWRRHVPGPKGDPMDYLIAAVAIAIGVAAMAAGNADDAPGLVLIGLLMVVAAGVFGARKALRRT